MGVCLINKVPRPSCELGNQTCVRPKLISFSFFLFFLEPFPKGDPQNITLPKKTNILLQFFIAISIINFILRGIFIIRLKQRNSRCKVVAQSNKDSFSRKRSLLFVEGNNGGAPFFQKHARSVQFRKCLMHHIFIFCLRVSQ